MAAPMKRNVDLGFVEEIADKWKLLSHFFPSKVGGTPSWLSLKPVPSIEDVKCGKCEKSCVFLLQIYAPITENVNCFHRTLFLFLCRNPDCSRPGGSPGLVALRSQLSRVNDFYSDQPPDENHFDPAGDFPRAGKYQSLCSVCGCEGSKKCGRCHVTTYCSKEHQTTDWKFWHKHHCGKDDNETVKPTSALLFPEYELITEAEEYTEEPEKSEELKMKEYKEFLKTAEEEGSLIDGKATERDLKQMAAGEEKGDKQFDIFKKLINTDPEQVLRYDIGGEPLWVSAEGKLEEKEMPNCSCGSKRQFEFQVLPQLLNHLGLDRLEESVDWGTLAVYTCKENCQPERGYHREFTWKQDFTGESLPT